MRHTSDNPCASVALAELLQHFRQCHEEKLLQNGIDSWKYLCGGKGETAIIVIPGSGGTAESMFTVHAALESRARVISLGIPATVSTTEQAVDGIRSILDSVRLPHAVFLGHSLGGLVAQAFASCHPGRVSGLVLSNTGFYRGGRAYLLPRAVQCMSWLPNSLLQRTVGSQMNRLLSASEARDFWRRFYGEQLRDPDSGVRLKQQCRLMCDMLYFFRDHAVLPTLEWAQSTPVRILSSADDRGFTRDEIAFLGSLYRRSQTVVFPKETGHLGFLTRPAEYMATVQAFLDEVEARP
jgi:pimeloyl-ACP methyl ester carboxylesterase